MRALLLAIVIIVGAYLAYTYFGGSMPMRPAVEHGNNAPAGTTGTIDAQKARDRGAELGEKAAEAANKVGETVGEAAVTTKIKAKMARDDTVKARTINVSTSGTVVTLTGTVGSAAERGRAFALARETSGVTRVVDRLSVEAGDR